MNKTHSIGNILVMQSGGCTAVINRSLAGVIRSCTRLLPNQKILGSHHGISGLISNDITDLSNVSDRYLSELDYVPGADLGSSRQKLSLDNSDSVIANLKAHDIHVVIPIGGNDSADTGLTLCDISDQHSYPLQVVNVPKTIDNDLLEMDHCPGYGSAARFISQATFGAGKDASSMGIASPITIIEVMGRDAGWLAASSALHKKSDFDAPHFIGIPEIPIKEDYFLSEIRYAYNTHGYAVAVIAENVRGLGNTAKNQKPYFTDSFGHEYYDGPARYLATLVSEEMNLRCRYEKPGTIQRSLIDSISDVDAQEAHIAGEKAVEAAIRGETNVIITLNRSGAEGYECVTGTTPLSRVANLTRKLPKEFLPLDGGHAKPDFINYLAPLTGKKLPFTTTIQ